MKLEKDTEKMVLVTMEVASLSAFFGLGHYLEWQNCQGSIFFFYGNEHLHTLNIKTTVTWYHDLYGCQGYKNNKQKKSNN